MKSSETLSCFVLMFSCLCIACNACADTHYVSKTGSDTPPYDSWETAALSIQAAIDIASEGDIVLIGPGVFVGSPGAVVSPKSDLEVRGAGPDLTVIEGRGESVISCVGIHGVVIEGLTATGPDGIHWGRGIRIEDCAGLFIRGCTIRGNTSKGDPGAGIYVLRSQVMLANCVVEGNSCLLVGGYRSEEAGGGIYALASGVTITNCAVRSNIAGTGGGIFLAWSPNACRIENSEVVQNSARGGSGGGISCFCKAEIVDSVIADNYAERDGGGIWCGEGATVRGSLICNNGASGYKSKGGGVCAWGADGGALINCIIADNGLPYGGYGAGAYFEASPNVVNCTIADNSGGTSGDGIFVEYPAHLIGTYGNVINSIIVDNGYQDLDGCRADYSMFGGKYDWTGEGNIQGAHPSFRFVGAPPVGSVRYDVNERSTVFTFEEPLAGPGELLGSFLVLSYDVNGYLARDAMLVRSNTANEVRCYGHAQAPADASVEITDFSLARDSTCIDAGNNAAEYLPEEDKAGNFRIYRGKSEWRVDMGAYEYGSRRFSVSAVEPTAEPGHLKITWNTQPLPGKSYSIYFSADLLDWTLAGSDIPSQGESTTWVDPYAGFFPKRFHKVSSP